jgi:CarboxypepD_reg-like domain
MLAMDFCLLGQDGFILVKGKVCIKGTAIPIDFVSIGIANSYISTYSSTNGDFELHIPTRYLVDSSRLLFSALGYSTAQFSLAEKDKNQLLHVFLSPKDNELNPVAVVGYSAKTIVSKAIDNVTKTYYQKPFIQSCFFRQYHRENGTYVRLIDAFVDVYHPAFYQTNSHVLRDRFVVRAVRRSNVYEQNGDMHGDHLSDLLMENLIVYTLGSPFNQRNLNYFNFHFSNEDDSLVYTINFETKPFTNEKKLKGTLLINKGDLAFVRVECYRYPEKIENNNWKFVNGHLLISFQKVHQQYVIDTLKMFYNHDVKNKINDNYQWTVEENFELYTLSNQFENVDSLHEAGSFSDMSNLYQLKYATPVFNSLLNQFKPYIPFPVGLQKDVEFKSIPIEEQFIRNGD